MGIVVEMLRASDVAPLLGVTTRRVYQLIRAGRLPGLRTGRAVRIPRRAWEQWLNACAEQATSALVKEDA